MLFVKGCGWQYFTSWCTETVLLEAEEECSGSDLVEPCYGRFFCVWTCLKNMRQNNFLRARELLKNWQELTQCRNSIIYFHCVFFFLWLIFNFFHHFSSSLFQRTAPLPFRKLVWRATCVTFHLSFELLSNRYFFSDVCLPFPLACFSGH